MEAQIAAACVAATVSAALLRRRTLSSRSRFKFERFADGAPRPPRRAHALFFGAGHCDDSVDVAQLMTPVVERADPFFWMRDDDRQDDEVLALIAAENTFTESCLNAALQESLYTEILSHLKETDVEAKVPESGWMYYSRKVEGSGYQIHCRVRPGDGAAEEVILDENVLADGRDMCDVHFLEASPDHCSYAYGVDFTGDETYTVHFLDAGVPGTRTETIEGVSGGGSFAWGDPAQGHVYYVVEDAAQRPYKVLRRTLGSAPEHDETIFAEDDPRFNVGIWRTKSGKFLVVEAESSTQSETRLVDLESGDVLLVAARRQDVLYDVSHLGEKLLIRSNCDGAKNFKVLTAPLPAASGGNSAAPGAEWSELYPADDAVVILDVDVSAERVVFKGRSGGVPRLWAMLVDTATLAPRPETLREIAFDASFDGIYAVWLGANEEFGVAAPTGDAADVTEAARFEAATAKYASSIRFGFSAPTFPTATFVVNDVRALFTDAGVVGGGEGGFASAPTLSVSLADAVGGDDRVVTLLKQREVPNFDPTQYASRRIIAQAPMDDLERGTHGGTHGAGAQQGATASGAATVGVPISLVFRKDAWGSGAKPAAPMPMLLDGYGSYAYCNDPYFDADILPLLDRGAIWAVAHVRGGGEMGRATWYEDGGKFERKSNTFSDFVACARALVAAEITTSDALAIEGRSAGGLLVGAVLNRADAYEYDARGVATKSLFAAAVAGVPFVDVMATMSDASIPLTCGEWEEWGNPHEEKAFKDMLDYSPVDNVVPRPYPALLATAGLHDSRVAYWEPLKWAATLRYARERWQYANVPLYHLVPSSTVEALRAAAAAGDADAATYFPTTYAQDGFTHLTADASALLGVANMFYTDIEGDFTVLRLEPKLLPGEVKLEPAAAVGSKQHKRGVGGGPVPLFPHLYGGIPLASVVECSAVLRDADGTFLSIAAAAADGAGEAKEDEGDASEPPLYVKIETAGHFSLTDRYKKKRERALTLSFVVQQLGLEK